MARQYNKIKMFVASGQYIVSRRKEEILEALLGTCVGVTLCDRHAGVGGIIHLLLPEPTSMDNLWKPENYASTGLPIFIQALCDSGAQKERLEACIAGGALVGPLSDQDLALDIGGRTSEVVEKILNNENILISKREIGGFFSCRMDLDLMTWATDIEPIGIPKSQSVEADFIKPSPEEFDDAVKHVRPIPQIALKVIRMINNDTNSMSDIAVELRQDQILSARVIKLCNSALFGMKAKIDSIDRALVMLGDKRLLQLVISASLEEFYSQAGYQGYSLCKGGLFQHAIGTGMIAETLAGITGKASAGIAYTAGLLHDIGKIALDQYMVNAYTYFYRRIRRGDIDLIMAEHEIFGVDHTDVGSRMAMQWSLPEGLVEIITHHHLPELAVINPELTHLIYFADLIMSRFIVGQELEQLDTKGLASRLQRIGLNPGQFPMIIDRIPFQALNNPLAGIDEIANS